MRASFFHTAALSIVGYFQLFMQFFPNFEPKSVTIQPVFTIPQILRGAHNNHTTPRYEDSTGYLSLCVTALQNMREARMSSLGFLLSRLVVLKCKKSVWESHDDLWKHRFLGPTSTVPDSVGIGCDVIIYISNKFSGHADAGPGATLWQL